MARLKPIHPGEVLKYDFMKPLDLSATALAKAIGVTPARISEIVRGPSRHHRRDRVTPGKVLQHRRPELDEPSESLRTRVCGAGQGRSPACHPYSKSGINLNVWSAYYGPVMEWTLRSAAGQDSESSQMFWACAILP